MLKQKSTQSEAVDNFLATKPNKTTKTSYRYFINKFFKYNDKDPDQYIRMDFRKLGNSDKIDVQDQYERDIRRYWSYLIEEEAAPKTINVAISVIKSILIFYRIELDAIFWKNLHDNGPGNSAITDFKPLDKDIIKAILQNAEIKSKALFLMMASGGLRLNEVLSLTKEDIEFDYHGFTKVKVRPIHSKNKKPRITFISPEATRYLKIWIDTLRDQYLEVTVAKMQKSALEACRSKTMDDDTIFPIKDTTAIEIFNNLLKKTDLYEKDPKTGNSKIGTHSFRKFFRSNLGSRDLAEDLMGHSGYLSEYRLRSDAKKVIAYKGLVKNVSIFDTDIENPDQTNRIKDLENKLKKLQEVNARLMDDFSEKLNKELHKKLFQI